MTWLASASFPPHVADRLLNHVGGTISGVAALYQRGEFQTERRRALDAWGAHVLMVGEELGRAAPRGESRGSPGEAGRLIVAPHSSCVGWNLRPLAARSQVQGRWGG